jgi:hypothetical protein
MINLHERLSEFSYGYGVTREVEGLLASVGLNATPFLPSLLHEEELGFDVGFKDRGRVVVLQFKLGEELRRFHRSDSSQPIPVLARPFWRFRIDIAAHQFQRLIEFENADADVYYIAPRFSHWAAYERAFQDGEVLEKSLMLKPSEVLRGVQAQAGPPGVHRIVYDRARRYVCSEPVEVREERPDEMAREIKERVRRPDGSLERQIRRLFDRARPEAGPGGLTAPRQERLFARARRPVDAMAAIVGLEAWSQGAQLVFVTDSNATMPLD